MNIFDSIDARRGVADSYRNLISGLGTSTDKAAQGSFALQELNYRELQAMYRCDWLSKVIVDAPADDMCREWRRWNGGDKQIPAITRAERSLQVRNRVNFALKQAACYGGSAIIIGIEGDDPSTEMIIDSIPRGGVSYIHNLSRYELISGPMCRDPLSIYFGEPAYYQLATFTHSDVLEIHPSRVVRFIGSEQIEISRDVDAWGDSVLQSVYDAVRNASSTASCLASLIQECKIDVIKTPGLSERAIDPEYVTATLARFALASQSKSINGVLILDKEEDYEQKKFTINDFPKVLDGFLQAACGAAQIPATRLLGKSPGGLGSNGSGEVRHYYDTLAARQETKLRPALERLDRVLKRHALGSEPVGVDYEWLPLWQLDATEKAAIALQQAQTAQVLLATGLVPFDALALGVQSLIIAENTLPGFESALDEAIKAGKQVMAPTTTPDGSAVKNPSVSTKVAPEPQE